MTRDQFDVQIGRLVVLRGWPEDIEEYWPALCDVPLQTFTDACDRALRTRTWFPVPVELRQDCDAVARRPTAVDDGPRFEDLSEATAVEIKNPFGGPSIFVRVDREWTDYCDSCRDTGFAHRTCPETHCGRKREHGSHEFVEPCPCRDWNPTIRRRKDAQARYADAQVKR